MGAWYLYSPNAHRLDGLAQCEVLETMGYTRSLRSVDGVKECMVSPGDAAEGQAGTLAELAWTLGSSGIPPPAMCHPMSASYLMILFNVADYERDQLTVGPASRFRTGHDHVVELRCSGLVPEQLRVTECANRRFVGTRGTKQVYVHSRTLGMALLKYDSL